jgi:hypothetical protein
MAGVVAGAGAGFHRMSLKTQRRSSGKNKSCEAANDHHLRRAPARLPSVSSLAGRLLLLLAMEFLGVLVLETESLGWQRLGRQRIGESLGAPEIVIYGTGEEVVAGDHGAYPKKFGKWRDSPNRTVAESFGIQAESYSV